MIIWRDVFLNFICILDIEGLDAGENFPEHIVSKVSNSQVFLVAIGQEWLYIKDSDGNRRLRAI